MDQRIDYLDFAKGFAIISVVFYHVASPLEYHVLRDFINTYFLSLFFFISGFLSVGRSFDLSSIGSYLKKKARVLLVPFVVCAIFNYLYRKFLLLESPDLFIFSDAKGGYWFLLVLFYYFITLKIFFSFFHISQNRSRFCFLLIPFVIVVLLSKVLPINWYYLFSLSAFRRYYLVFLYGVFFRFYSITFSKKLVIISSFLYIVSIFFFLDHMTFFKSEVDFFIWLLTNISGCILWLNICKLLSSPLSFLCKLGVNSLGIYVLHYFFFQFFCLLYYIMGMRAYLLLLIVASTLILLLTYYTTIFISKNKYLSFLFLGK